MDINRVNYKVHRWEDSMKTRAKNWYFHFQKHISGSVRIEHGSKISVKNTVTKGMGSEHDILTIPC